MSKYKMISSGLKETNKKESEDPKPTTRSKK